MIKVVCFDFFNTLAYFYPSREETYPNICRDLGISVTPEAIGESLPKADAYWRAENYKSRISDREQKEKFAVYAEYGVRILKGAGVEITSDIGLQILAKASQVGFKFELYEDSLPTLEVLKKRGFKLGLLSNVGQDIDSDCQELGLEPLLDFKVTSFEVGFDKPHPEIFLAALKKAAVTPEEIIYVGDQYDQDILGARNVGIKAILIKRNGSPTSTYDCPVISSLPQLAEYLPT